eukprot:11992429-Karenia_brevis.AAC.1
MDFKGAHWHLRVTRVIEYRFIGRSRVGCFTDTHAEQTALPKDDYHSSAAPQNGPAEDDHVGKPP